MYLRCYQHVLKPALVEAQATLQDKEDEHTRFVPGISAGIPSLLILGYALELALKSLVLRDGKAGVRGHFLATTTIDKHNQPVLRPPTEPRDKEEPGLWEELSKATRRDLERSWRAHFTADSGKSSHNAPKYVDTLKQVRPLFLSIRYTFEPVASTGQTHLVSSGQEREIAERLAVFTIDYLQALS